MSTIRFASKDDLSSLKKLWKVCFEDEDDFIDFYFANRFKPDQMIVLEVKDTIVSMVTLIPCNINTPYGDSNKAHMIYAVGTDPKYQKLGYSTRVLDFCNDYIKANYDSTPILVPANRELFKFYKKRGYKEGFYINELKGNIESLNITNYSINIKPIDSLNYNIKRKELLKEYIYIDYNIEEIEYQKQLSYISGSNIYMINIDNNICIASAEKLDKDNILIKELLVDNLDSKLVNKAIYAILKETNTTKFTTRLVPNADNISNNKSFGMLADSKREALGYLGLAFD